MGFIEQQKINEQNSHDANKYRELVAAQHKKEFAAKAFVAGHDKGAKDFYRRGLADMLAEVQYNQFTQGHRT